MLYLVDIDDSFIIKEGGLTGELEMTTAELRSALHDRTPVIEFTLQKSTMVKFGKETFSNIGDWYKFYAVKITQGKNV